MPLPGAVTLTFFEAREEFYRVYLRHVVATHENPTEAARFARINRTHLYALCRRYGVRCGTPHVAYPRCYSPPVIDETARKFESPR